MAAYPGSTPANPRALGDGYARTMSLAQGTASSDIPVVTLVCSAGGLDALTRVVEQLPADLPAAVLVLQHHSPETENVLAKILTGRTSLEVASAESGDRLECGRILVAPAGKHTLVTSERRIALIISGTTPPYRPSADLLLTSVALAVGRQAIAVVLSGYGNDGATGATAIHEFGGIVIASDQATSEVFAMPEATIGRDHIIDHVVPLGEIAGLLIALVTAPDLGLAPAAD